ncbi:MAG: peptide ABC transporter substrate-binding protein [Myxococcaceae bacterium]|nr:peptide ABC transporter substrate-binding protein [Myxococcaceae bacterium]MBH2006594.1 peptide ABC transporter substrate-binding protein [Myxococcaceae bacterium]
MFKMSNPVFGLLSGVFWFACSPQAVQVESGPVRPGTVIIGLSQEPDSLFVPFKEMMVSEEIVRIGNYTLTIFNENWDLIPWAAKEIPTLANGGLQLFIENGAKKMRTTWKIRDDFFWADGKPLVADDFILNYEITQDPTQEVIDRTSIEAIEKMEQKDPKTLVITWKEHYAYYHNYRNHEALPAHIIGPIYRANPEKLKQHEFGQQPLLAGAFTIHQWLPGETIRARRNLFAKGKHRPKLDEIIWRIIPQTNTLESNLVAGDIDAISSVGLDLDQALNFQKRFGKDYHFYFTPGLLWEHIDFNLDNPILQDKRVRQALAYGANRAKIADLLFAGKQPVAHGTEPEKSPFYNADVRKYAYDVSRANQLLEEAGWLLSKPKEIRRKNGKPLKLVLMSTSGNKSRERVEQLLQAEWRKIGVEIEIKNQPAKVFFSETVHKRRFQHMALYSWVKDPVKLSDTLWRCDHIPRESNSFLGQNIPGFCDAKVDQLLKSASLELNVLKRIRLGQELEAVLAEELPALPLYFRVEVTITKKGLKNWKPTGILQPVTWNAHEWSW